jgi:serine/threonine protein kinase
LDGRPSTAPTETLQIARPSNENPFTPHVSRSKRAASPLHGDDDLPAPDLGGSIFGSPFKRRAKGAGSKVRSGANISRFHQEFEEQGELGAGEFGVVLKCKNRLDGTLYAIKRSKKQITGMADEQKVLREVYAHAVVETQPHIVRYHSAWEEDDHMLIQNEFCDGGSLEAVIAKNQQEGKAFPEDEVIRILKHVALGLRSLHGKRLAHLDIKPGNVFLKSEEAPDTPRAESPESQSPLDKSMDSPAPSASCSGGAATPASDESTGMDISPAVSNARPRSDAFSGGARPSSLSVMASGEGDAAPMSASKPEGMPDDTAPPISQNLFITRPPSTPREGTIRPMQTLYKLGDLGHVTRTDEPSVEEGDTRYLAKELLAEDYRNLTKADIFSAGIMVHEVASCNPLPMNGDAWHALRDGSAPHLPRYSHNLNQLIESMLHPDCDKRPTANGILSHPALVQQRKVLGLQKSKTQLYNELNAEKLDKFRIMSELQMLKDKDPVARIVQQNRGPGMRRNSAPSRPMRFSSASW